MSAFTEERRSLSVAVSTRIAFLEPLDRELELAGESACGRPSNRGSSSDLGQVNLPPCLSRATSPLKGRIGEVDALQRFLLRRPLPFLSALPGARMNGRGRSAPCPRRFPRRTLRGGAEDVWSSVLRPFIALGRGSSRCPRACCQGHAEEDEQKASHNGAPSRSCRGWGGEAGSGNRGEGGHGNTSRSGCSEATSAQRGRARHG